MDSQFEGRDELLEVIDEFVDGERVNPRELKDALSDPAGRDYFVEAWMLREGMQEGREARVADPQPVPATIAPKRTVRRWVAAAALAVSATGGYFVGYRVSQPELPTNAPTPSTTPVAAGPQAQDPAVLSAPQPTRVIQLEFQPDSRTSGGD